MKNVIIGLKQLREDTEKYIREVEKGRSFVVARKSRAVFKISPAQDDDSLWEEVIDFTRIKKGGIPIHGLLSRL